MQQIQMQYNIIFGQSYILVPMDWTEIKPIKVLGTVQKLKKAHQISSNTKNR